LFSIARNQAGAKFGEHGVIKAAVLQFQAQGIFPGQPISHGISGWPIR
jgi:hypothetical protein